jgi:hypothetical protein
MLKRRKLKRKGGAGLSHFALAKNGRHYSGRADRYNPRLAQSLPSHRIWEPFDRAVGGAKPAVPPIRPGATAERIRRHFVGVPDQKEAKQEEVMGRGLLLWLLGIPIPIIILIWLLGGLHG